jgi:hypothetical protein
LWIAIECQEINSSFIVIDIKVETDAQADLIALQDDDCRL